MSDLDLTVGKDLQDRLCGPCRKRLQVITRGDVLFAVTLVGLRRLLQKIEKNTCPDCRQLIFAQGVRRDS